jgi:hypothetical protein
MSIIPTLLCVLLLLPVAAAASDETGEATATVADGRPDLSGEWVFNRETSDDPAAVMRQAFSGGGRGGGMAGSMGRGGGGRGGGMGRGRTGGGPRSGERPTGDQDGRNPGAHLLERYGTLSVFHDADEIDFTDGMDISRLLHADGKAEKVWTERGQVLATARWLDDDLEILWQGGGGERTSRYALSEDGKQLVVTEEILRRGSDEKIELRLVYDRIAGNSPTATK